MGGSKFLRLDRGFAMFCHTPMKAKKELAHSMMDFSDDLHFEAKDFIETQESLMFAVVASGLENGKVLCFLRYAKMGECWTKMSTNYANQWLALNHPDYLYYSKKLDAHLHAVPVVKITRHHQPKRRFHAMLTTCPEHPVETDLLHLATLLSGNGLDLSPIGITGSVLIGLQHEESDIDLVCFNRTVFHQCRTLIRDLIQSSQLQALRQEDWQASYRRRACTLSLKDYIWHEQRKFNKALVNGRKFDLSLVQSHDNKKQFGHHKKEGLAVVQCRVLDDYDAFAYPAQWCVDHPDILSVVCYTATYFGQAMVGERIEVSGTLERSASGLRIVVGSSREAPGEYIKVIDAFNR